MGWFTKILLHQGPHFDEILAFSLWILFGKEKGCEGIDKAKIIFIDEMPKDLQGLTAKELMERGILPIGVLGGLFDEHAPNGVRKPEECAAKISAKMLEVEKNPELQLLLNFAYERDTTPTGRQFDLPNLVKVAHRRHPNDPNKVIKRTLEWIEDFYRDQCTFFQAVEEFNQNAQKLEIVGPNGKKLKLAIIDSDNQLTNKIARSPHGGMQDVIIQFQLANGHCQIFTNQCPKNQAMGLSLGQVIKFLRYLEQKKKQVEISDHQVLSNEGVVEGAEEWYYFLAGEHIYNGTPTHPEVPVTKLSKKQIIDAVIMGLNPNYFHPEFQKHCERGECYSSKSKPCPIWPLGLAQCFDVRSQQREQNDHNNRPQNHNRGGEKK